MGAYDWPGIPDGFDAVRRGRHMFLILRADVGVAVLSGMTSREPLMLHARAERATDMEKATALSARLTEIPAAQAIGLVVGWWRDHVKACVEGGLGLPHDDMRESLKANEGESFQTIPASLNAWRRGRQRQIEQDRIARRISAAVQIDDYDKLFEASGRRRRLVAILGPTNSGKTHLALERLAKAKSGYFCGPLRLLSLEVYERMNREFEVDCSLITGEERRIVEGASHVACTVEMVDPTRRVEVAVIDEVQMISDRQRGWAWTQAVACANADEVYVLGSPQIRGVIERFALQLDVDLEVRIVERLSPLRVADRPLGKTPRQALENVRKGDCLVVFTRRDCLALRDDLLTMGHVVACVYGALSPEARQAEAERFTSGAAGVIVATDAIGLGLNLKGLMRTVLVASQKYDGRTRADVPIDLVRQIAGRAGRYGGTAEDEGVAVGLTKDEHDLVTRALSVAPADIEMDHFPVAPSGEVLKKLEEVSGQRSLEVLLRLFVEHCSAGKYRAQLPGDALERAYLVDQFDLPVEVRFMLKQVPVSGRDDGVQAQWLEWCKAVEQHTVCTLDFLPSGTNGLTLAEAERNVGLLNGYGWLSLRMSELFPQEREARQLVRDTSAFVGTRLRSRSMLGDGSESGRGGLPSWYWQRRVEVGVLDGPG